VIALILFVSNDSTQLLPIIALSIGILGAALFSTGRSLSEVWKLGSPKDSRFSINEILSTSAPLMLVALGSYFLGNISVYLIQIFEDTRQVGIFSLSLKLSLLISFILIAINTVRKAKTWNLLHLYKRQLNMSFYYPFFLFLLWSFSPKLYWS